DRLSPNCYLCNMLTVTNGSLSLLLPSFLFQSSRTARSEEDRDTLWDAWGSWSECSRTCGGGASYSLRRCLSSNCEGRNIRYRTCSNVDCPPEAGDFRTQQCSAHNDVKYQGQFYEWLPVSNDPDNPCSLKCQAKGTSLVVELAPKVLDGTRCYTESLDMCISGVCQIVGCDHQLGSTVKEDNCGVCNGDGSTCRLVRGQYKSQLLANKLDDTVVAIPYGSRHVRLVLKGPDHLYLETKTLQGVKGETSLSSTGSFLVDNSSVDFQKFPDKEILRMPGPLTADFTVKIHYAGAADSTVQFIFYQPIIHRWRETDFFPCSASCGGGYQLTSAECYDLRSNRVVADQYCHYYPENVKPKPKLQECNLDPCPASDGYKQIMPYDLYHPLPRWESTPWTACSSSCGGGIQSRTVSCVEEDIQGLVSSVEEWKCMYTPKMPIVQPCNVFDCPKWLAQEWSPCTVTCGQGLRYRVVLCIDYRGMHTGGCSPKTKPHIKEECIIPTPCYKPKEKLPVEAKLPWYKQAQELEEGTVVSEEPTFIPEAWSACSVTCGVGIQVRLVKCQVLLSFSQSVADLPIDECEGPKPASERACYGGPCNGDTGEYSPEEIDLLYGGSQDFDELYDWEYEGFTECSESCGGGVQEAIVACLNKQTREFADENLCVSSRRPPPLLKSCSLEPCPPRWEIGKWSSCSLTCGVGLQTRDVFCSHLLSRETNETVILANELCHRPKPTMVQACNRFDCPPSWYLSEWQQCSQTCRGGIKKREVLCKQRMADGSFLELPETFCSTLRPASQQACKNEDCLPEWLLSDWTQCSVSCGEGTQTRNAICRKMLSTGLSAIINSSLCPPLPFSSLVKPCTLASCASEYLKAREQPPLIMAQKKVFIQTRKQKKLHFIVGGYAYLLPKTSVILRCPVRRFRKPMITWEKDGKRLISSVHVTVAPYGYMKIHRLKPSDTGTYTCTAGPAQEHFVIKLIGGHNKRIVTLSAGMKEEETMKKGSLNEALHTQEKHQNGILFNGSKTEKRGLLTNPSSRYDYIVSRLLEYRGWPRENTEPWEAQDSTERNISSEEDQGQEFTLPSTMVANQDCLDDILRNLSQQPEELKDVYSKQLVAQLAHEIFRSHLEHQESLFKTQGSRVSSASVEFPFSKHFSEFTSCPVDGHPTPNITWFYAGQPISKPHHVLASGQVLQILNISSDYEGEISCMAQNEAGLLVQKAHLVIQGKNKAHISFWMLGTVDKMSPCSASCGNKGLQYHQLRCLLDGTQVNMSHCMEKPKPALNPVACNRRDCPARWMVTSWSQCTQGCGGGIQTRRVTCQKLTAAGNSVPMPNDACVQVAKRPVDTQSCNRQLCVEWATSTWGQCNGPCVGSHLSVQHRQAASPGIFSVPSVQRPLSTQNCWTDTCGVHWRVSLWTLCTATCGNYGFQSRRVECIRGRTNKPVQEHFCAWRPRPANWQRCNITPCENVECRDTTRYCEKVKQLKLCQLSQFKSRCCGTCGKA
uniref:ADAMTS like 1 n=1 Tax=Varanus komodoensis TaxID=61221 RepID=A0A8D2LH55_VARKO